MNTDDPGNLADLEARLSFLLSRPITFTATDIDTTLTKIRILTAAALYFNTLSVSDFGGRVGATRAPGLVEQVVAAGFQTFGGFDPHPSAFEKAAMLLRGITAGHPFTDGNKRTGILVAGYFLRLMGIRPKNPPSPDEGQRLCFRISSGDLRDIDEISRELQRIWGFADADEP